MENFLLYKKLSSDISYAGKLEILRSEFAV